MRRALAAFAAVAVFLMLAAHSVAVIAQPAPPPPKLEPITEKPPALIGFDEESVGDRGVRLTPGAAERVEESVIDGKRTIRVINPNGWEYELSEDLGDGTAARQDSHDSGYRPPRWVILRF
jgi:Protein of unknown function (DUF2782)